MDQFVKQVLEEEKFSQEQKELFAGLSGTRRGNGRSVVFGKILPFCGTNGANQAVAFRASTNVLGQSEKAMESKEKGKGGIA
ncbi:MAG: hypothetical protein ACLU7M_05505 [Mediterraneibacter gnavus]